MNRRKKDIISHLVAIITILAIVIIANRFFFRIDLTSDKRYTVSDNSKTIIKNLDDVVFIKVYLDGDMNIAYNRMRKKIKETLQEFKVIGKQNIEYVFENPFIGRADKEKRLQELVDEGFRYAYILGKDEEGGRNSKPVIPGVIISYKSNTIVVNLLEENSAIKKEDREMIQVENSIKSLEYNIIRAIKVVTQQKKEKIAFIQGHGELDRYDVYDMILELSNSYDVEPVWINGKNEILDKYKLIIIAKPTERFSKEDKIVIDQYIMNGGKVLWAIDRMNVPVDSLENGTLLVPYDLNLDDMLFKYGVRINPEIIQDFQSDQLPLIPNYSRASYDFTRWPYYILFKSEKSPVSPEMQIVRCQYASPVDLIEARKEIQKTVLLKTSKLSRLKKASSVISYGEVEYPLSKSDYDTFNLVTGVLLEGKFKSNFDRPNMKIYLGDELYKVKKESDLNKMVIISDGDIIRNEYKVVGQGQFVPYPVGYNVYSHATFSNREFLMNVISYLTDDIGLMSIRTRNLKVRRLDQMKIENKTKWQVINLISPVLLIAVLGFLYIDNRKKKYTR